ncbi:MAG TPA: hypothetical protein VM692_09740 [Gammaproteobacteria bacterium]|nr:hypothetical protein [Gammaproteobacteria bacterium]
MQQRSAETWLTDEIEAAIQAYCATLTEMASDAAQGRAVSAEQLERAAEAGLRLENASTLFELSAWRRRQRPTQLPAPRRAH